MKNKNKEKKLAREEKLTEIKKKNNARKKWRKGKLNETNYSTTENVMKIENKRCIRGNEMKSRKK